MEIEESLPRRGVLNRARVGKECGIEYRSDNPD